jgi:hypothetical protein
MFLETESLRYQLINQHCLEWQGANLDRLALAFKNNVSLCASRRHSEERHTFYDRCKKLVVKECQTGTYYYLSILQRLRLLGDNAYQKT